MARTTSPTGLARNVITAPTPLTVVVRIFATGITEVKIFCNTLIPFPTESTIPTMPFAALAPATHPAMTSATLAIASPIISHCSVLTSPFASDSSRLARSGATDSMAPPIVPRADFATFLMASNRGITTFPIPLAIPSIAFWTFRNVRTMFSLNSSTSTPALSSRVPSRELLPCMKLIKSSTSRTTVRRAAKSKTVFALIPVSNLEIADRPDVILLKFRMANRALPVMTIRRSILSMPPSLSESQTTPFRTRFRTPMTLLNAETINLPILFVRPTVSLV